MTVVWFVARTHLRRHWRTFLVVAALAGVAGAAVLAAVDGARRTGTAIPRFLAEIRAPDISGYLPPDDDGRFDVEALAPLASSPGVVAVAPAAVVGMIPVDHAIPLNLESQFLPFVGIDERLGRDVLVPRLVAGRRSDPARPDEMVVTETTAADLGLEVGDVVRFGSYTLEQLEEALEGGWDAPAPAGLRVELEVVGVVRALSDLQRGFGTAGAHHAYDVPFILTPAFLEQHRSEVLAFEGFVLARLWPDADPSSFIATFDDLAGDEGFVGRETILASLGRAVDTERLALLAFAAIVALAGMVVVGQALGRQASLTRADQSTLRALGVSSAGRLSVSIATAAPLALVASAAALGGAVAVSPLVPIGVAGRADPDQGISVAPVFLTLGASVVGALVLTLGTVVAWRATRHTPRRPRSPRERPASARLTSLGLPPLVHVGVQMSVVPGRGPRAVPVRLAGLAVAVGVAGVMSALVVASSLDRVLATPDRYGRSWDVMLEAATDAEVAAQQADDVGARPEVATATLISDGLVRIGGERVWAVAFEPSAAAHEVTVLEGRPPRTIGEVALATATMVDLDRGIGDTVPVGPDDVEHVVVGRLVMPRTPDNDDPARGAAVSGDLSRVGGFCDEISDGPCRYVVVGLIPGTDVEAATASLVEDGYSVYPNLRPVEVETLAQVDAIPYVLAAVLVLLGVVVLAHALSVGVRRRRRDLAVLESLGFVGGQVRGVVAVQATTVAVLAVVAGIPVGLGVGRWGWRALARDIGIGDDPLVPLGAVVAVAVLVPLIANLIAAPPARAATRIRPAALLRSE